MEVMPFGLLEGDESAVLWDLPVRQSIHWVVDQLAFLYFFHVFGRVGFHTVSPCHFCLAFLEIS